MSPPYIADLEAERACVIVLPFPSSKLSGHNNAHHWVTRPVTNQHREWAKNATLSAKPSVASEGDIGLHVHFIPPDRRGDRTNYWNRCKAYFDGIAEALKINDARFLPSMSFGRPEKPGRVEIEIGLSSADISKNLQHDFSARVQNAVDGLPPETEAA
jgi:crossover junction endodeoxyribonuclease RusA